MRTLRKPLDRRGMPETADLHAAGASAVRAALALKKSRNAVKTKARELGISFQHVLERRKHLKETRRVFPLFRLIPNTAVDDIMPKRHFEPCIPSRDSRTFAPGLDSRGKGRRLQANGPARGQARSAVHPARP